MSGYDKGLSGNDLAPRRRFTHREMPTSPLGAHE